jgi:hypothetical protein
MSKRWWVMMLGGFSFWSTALGFDCSDQKRITLEIIEAELSGVRSLMTDELPACIALREFKTVIPVHQDSGEDHYQKPEFMVPKNAVVKVLKETDPEENRRVVEVRFSYPTVGGKIIEDELTYRKVSRSKVKKRGCAEIQALPVHFSMREDCLSVSASRK